MELRRLRYFLTVAEQRSLTRAARHLNVSQPALTQCINALEREMNLKLFIRGRDGVELTDAGKAFRLPVSRIVADVQHAVEVAKRAARGRIGNVRVGLTESASFNSRVTAALHKFHVSCPSIEVSMEQDCSAALLCAVQDKRIDVAFIRSPGRVDDQLEILVIDEEEMVVALSNQHPLARRELFALEELADEAFVLCRQAQRPDLSHEVVSACQRVGFEPMVRQYAPRLSSTINLVATSLGVSIVPRSMQWLQPQAVVYRPLRGAPIRLSLALAHRLDETSQVVSRFVRVVSSLTSPNRSIEARGARAAVFDLLGQAGS